MEIDIFPIPHRKEGIARNVEVATADGTIDIGYHVLGVDGVLRRTFGVHSENIRRTFSISHLVD